MAAGDVSALATFYEFAFDVMYREAVRVSSRDEQACLDIVQDAMLKAMRCMRTMDDERSVANWSRAVAKSVAYDWLRSESRRRRVDQERLVNGQAANKDDAVPDALPLEKVDQQEARLQWLEEELRQLPADLQGLISLRYRWGWSLRKIGQLVGLKTGAVDGRLRRAIEKLKMKAESQFDEP